MRCLSERWVRSSSPLLGLSSTTGFPGSGGHMEQKDSTLQCGRSCFFENRKGNVIVAMWRLLGDRPPSLPRDGFRRIIVSRTPEYKERGAGGTPRTCRMRVRRGAHPEPLEDDQAAVQEYAARLNSRNPGVGAGVLRWTPQTISYRLRRPASGLRTIFQRASGRLVPLAGSCDSRRFPGMKAENLFEL